MRTATQQGLPQAVIVQTANALKHFAARPFAVLNEPWHEVARDDTGDGVGIRIALHRIAPEDHAAADPPVIGDSFGGEESGDAALGGCLGHIAGIKTARHGRDTYGFADNVTQARRAVAPFVE